ncbi:MAG: DUF2807 domain-containing protein [Calditrichaeota bacterium]|nr:MAG: DUF2807 domain-containing protein [Calditrichota bacterium]
MKKFNLINFFLILGLISACASAKNIKGNGNVVAEKRNVSNFEKVVVDGSFKVFIEHSKNETLEIEAEENILPHIISEVRGDVLRIYTENNVQTTETIKVRIGSDEVDYVELNGSGKIEIDNFQNDRLSVEMNGSGKIYANGKTKDFDVEINGSGKVESQNLKAENVDVEINGSGKVEISSERSINSDINGSGKIIYHGNPTNISNSVNGSGKIVKGS